MFNPFYGLLTKFFEFLPVQLYTNIDAVDIIKVMATKPL